MNFLAGTVVGPGCVRTGPLELSCGADGLPVGTRVTVAVRPEDIVFEGAGTGQANVLEARVEGLVFLGSFFRADLVAGGPGGASLRADLPVELVRRLGVEEGHRLVARLPPERIRVYPAGTLPG
jgi:hypothetical protein